MATYREVDRRRIVIYNPIKDFSEDPEIDYSKLCEKYYIDTENKIFEIDIVLSVFYPNSLTVTSIEIENGTKKSIANSSNGNLNSYVVSDYTDITSKTTANYFTNYWNNIIGTYLNTIEELRSYLLSNDYNKFLVAGKNFFMYYLPAVGKINTGNAIEIVDDLYQISVPSKNNDVTLDLKIDKSYLSPTPMIINPIIVYTKIFCCCDMPLELCMEHYVTPMPVPINCT